MEEKNKKVKRKKRIKEQISIFTIILWIALIATMTVVTINGISRSNALEESTRMIILKIDFSEYLKNEDIAEIEDIESFMEEYIDKIKLLNSNVIDDDEDYYEFDEYDKLYLGLEENKVGIYEVEVPENAKYCILDYKGSDINTYYNVLYQNQMLEEIKDNYEDGIYYGFKIDENINEYNIKVAEKEKRKITVKIDFDKYFDNNNITDQDQINNFFQEYGKKFIAFSDNINGEKYEKIKAKYLSLEDNRIGVYEIGVLEEVKYLAIDYYTTNTYYDISSNVDIEYIKDYVDEFFGVKINENINEYNIKLIEKEKRKITVKIDFGQYFINNNILEQDKINNFFEEYSKSIVATKSKFINYKENIYNDCTKFIRSEDNRIGIYEVTALKDVNYILIDAFIPEMNYYNILCDDSKIENFNYKIDNIYHGFRINENIDKYNIKFIEKGNSSITVKVDFSEYLENEEITDEEEINKILERFYLGISKTNIIKSNDEYHGNIRYIGKEENNIGVYEIKFTEEIQYVILEDFKLGDLEYYILISDNKLEEIKSSYGNAIYNGFKIDKNINEYNIKICNREKRNITVKVDFSEYLENEEIIDEFEIRDLIYYYSRKFSSTESNTNNIRLDLKPLSVQIENNTIGVYEFTITDYMKYVYIREYTHNNLQYDILDENENVDYIFNGEYGQYFAQKIFDDVNEYKFIYKKKDPKKIRLDISNIDEEIDFEEYIIKIETNGDVLSTAELIELNDNYAIFDVYTPKNIEYNIVFNPYYKVFYENKALEYKKMYDNEEGYYFKNITDDYTDDYEFKLEKVYVEVKIKISGIDDITEEIENELKNLNIEARDSNTDEVISKLYFLNNTEKIYTYTSDKTYEELTNCFIYTELNDIKGYSINNKYSGKVDYEGVGDFNTYNYFNTKKNKWEHIEYSFNQVDIELDYEKIVDDIEEKKEIKFSKNLGIDIPKDLYENIIIFHKGSKWIFNKIDEDKYIYVSHNEQLPDSTDEFDIYVPKILENNFKAKIEDNLYIGSKYKGLYGDYYDCNYEVLGNKMEFVDKIILKSSDEDTGIYKDIEFIDNNHAKLDLSYNAFTNLDNVSNLYITEENKNSNYFSNLIIYKENLPKNFKVSDEYLNNNEWSFLDDISNKGYILPNVNDNFTSSFNIIESEIPISEDVMNEFIKDYYWEIDYTGKKYVYVKSTNTLYYLVDKIDIFGKQNINLEYIGNDNIENEYIVNNDVDAYYITMFIRGDVEGNEHPYYRTYINEYKLKEVDVEKRWEDNNNINNVRPDSIIAELKKDGETVKEKRLSNINNWKGKIYYVPEYDYKVVKDKDGKNIVEERKIEYTIDEKVVSPYYEKEVVGNVITNKYIDKGECINLDVNKKWIDENNKYNMRPSSIIIQVYDKDKVVAEEIVNEENEWKCSFKLPKYDENGDKIEYRIDEKERKDGELKYYDKRIDANSIINTLTYKEKVDTGDINVFLYMLIFLVAFIGVVLMVFIKRKNIESKNQ